MIMKKFTFLMMFVALATFVSKAQIDPAMDGLTGLYEFTDDGDLFANTATTGAGVGTVMCEGVMKFDPDGGTSDDDMPSVMGTDYFYADGIISMNAHNWFKVWHGIPANGGGSYVNQFTIVVDVRVSDAGGIYSLLEVNPTPSEGGYTSELEIADMKVGTVGAPASGEDPLGFSDNTLSVDTWYRIIYAPDLNTGIYVYVDGVLWKEKLGDFSDARPAPYGADLDPADAAVKIGGNHEVYPANDPARDGNKEVSLVAVFNRTLSADEIAALGDAGSGVRSLSKNSFNLYPNPATDMITISGVENANVEIINIAGQLIHSAVISNDNSTVDVSRFSKGVYFVKVINNGTITTQKLIIE